jgi:DNA replication protein DnaC
VTTNLPFERCDPSGARVLGNERLVGATLDRVTHRGHLLEATGESYRLREARQRQNEPTPNGRKRRKKTGS